MEKRNKVFERFHMDLRGMIERLKAHPEYEKMGMIASHLGVVRGTSRDGQSVKGIEVIYDHDTVKNIVLDTKKLNGIVEVLVDTNEGYLKVGDDILAVAVGGDIRENVFPALVDTVNRIKKEAVKKKEVKAYSPEEKGKKYGNG
jgi:molybdopterin synthase catalytic subunit